MITSAIVDYVVIIVTCYNECIIGTLPLFIYYIGTYRDLQNKVQIHTKKKKKKQNEL